MTAQDTYSLDAAFDVALAGSGGGKLSIVNLNVGITITIEAHHEKFGTETFVLTSAGATLELPMDGIDSARISATAYPATILFDYATVPHILSTPQSFAGSSGGGATVNVETVGLAGSILQAVVTVGLVAVALPAVALPNRRTMLVQALASNTKTIYLGSATVTADEAATGGVQLVPGASMTLPVGGVVVYAISTAAAQHVAIIEGA